ncbi:Zinc finger RING-type protein [Macrophomina phaseolina MS6]|uniref:Zinc finger RING-type protein n=1 Tax=Macrophomina phaseolina (strain MS6) TaxID=1126212 RepID=K2R8T2_MACPH|nr:Zinc finger RING-type protein [Macrophomina phaseolina MS6]
MTSRLFLFRYLEWATPKDLRSTSTYFCSICFDELYSSEINGSVAAPPYPVCEYPMKLSCGHIFGINCIIRALQENGACLKCPMCRQRPQCINFAALTGYKFADCLLDISVDRLAEVAVPMLEALDQRWDEHEEKYPNRLVWHVAMCPLVFVKPLPKRGQERKIVRVSRLREAYYGMWEKLVPKDAAEAWTDFVMLVEVIMWRLAARYRVCAEQSGGRWLADI